MLFRLSIFCLINWLTLQLVTAQDSTQNVKHLAIKSTFVFPDSVLHFRTSTPIPKRAGLYAAILPGLGQVYNKQYWKTSVVAVGAGIITYFIIDNRKNYLKYQQAYIYRIDNNKLTVDSFPEYSTDDLNLLRNGFRKYYEYSVIAAAAGYFINIIDAFTSAHLKSFDLSKDISIHTSPFINRHQQIGIQLVARIH